VPLSPEAYLKKYGMPPLNAPGMPPPGLSFLTAARAMGENAVYTKKTAKGQTTIDFKFGKRLSRLYSEALRTPGFTIPVEIKQGSITKPAAFTPGHIWGESFEEYINYDHDPLALPPKPVTGPKPARVMVVGKMPGEEEVSNGRMFIAEDGQLLLDALKRLRFKDIDKWYITNTVKFASPTGNTTIRQGWVADCLPLLQAEMRLVKPDYILVLGADAAKAVIDKSITVTRSEGKVFKVQIPLHMSTDEEPQYHEAKAMVVLHPRQVLRELPMLRQLDRALARFKQLVDGVDIEKPEDDIDHRTVYTLEDAKELIAEAEADLKANGENFVAWDAEWHGASPRRKHSYVRTIQFSWANRKSVCFVTADTNGNCCFRDKDGKPALKRLAKLCMKFMKGKRAVGHFLTADIEWLTSFGIDLREAYEVPLHDDDDGTPAYLRCRNHEGGADTAAMAHAIEETGLLGLEMLAARYTSAPPWHLPLEEFKKEYCKLNKIKQSKLGGYGPIPDEILCPYANYDADVTRRIYVILRDFLDKDYQGHTCWEPFWDSMLAFNAIADMRHNGVMIDSERVPVMTKNFVKARERLIKQMKKKFRWPDFNPRNLNQVKEVLFGEHLNGRLDDEGQPERLRPLNGVTLGLTPIVDTSKPPKRWEQIVENNLEQQHSPSTGKSALSILLHETTDKFQQDGIALIRNFRFIDQVTKSVLRPPDKDKDGFVIIDDDGNPTYEKGLASCLDWDSRVRSFLIPTAETGRWKSSGPNMQNLSKNRDTDYKAILGEENYKNTIRSIVRASPGNVLVEFDYKGAELLGAAVMANDANMIDHVLRNQLPDGEDPPNVPKHKDYYDIHSAVACMAFKLKCEPTKAGLKSIGKKDLRNIAKTVIFGLMYGRQAKAIAMAAREQKVAITTEDAQKIIDTIYRLYPQLEEFFQDCQSRAVDERCLCSAYGRWRRFAPAYDDRMAGEFGRQAMNFPIQSMIASALNRGLGWFRYGLRVNGWTDVKLIMAIHDAVLLECPPSRVPDLCDKENGLIKWAMCKQVPIYPTTLDGMPNGRGPYHLGVSIDVSENWSEPVSLERGREIGLDPIYCHAA
jgi:uracil-DNA glycosylase family 4